MHFDPDPATVAFRQEVRDFLATPEAARFGRRNPSVYHASREEVSAWTRLLSERGWSAPNWPTEFGGAGWSPLWQSIFAEECYLANMPRTNVQGLQMVGPVIYTFGSDAQRARFLPPILRGDEMWAQGFSEPGSGSDLASLRTRAVRSGDVYVVNGQKIWTTLAQDADHIFCLVRTSTEGKAQEGISFLLVDATSPGLTIRPIHSIDDAHGLNEVFFEDVQVPVDHLVGEENAGWSYAKFLLANERTGGAADLPYAKKTLARLKEIVSSRGHALPEGYAARVAELEAEVRALDFSLLRLLGGAGERNPALASIVKIRGSELQQALSELLVESLGSYGAIRHEGWQGDERPFAASGWHLGEGATTDFLYRRAATIFGGTNEVQRNLIAHHALGRSS